MSLSRLGWAQRIALGMVATLLLPVVTVGLLVLVVNRVTALPEGVALRVDGTDVTDEQLRQRMDAFDALYGIAPPKDGPGRDAFMRQSAKAVAVSIVIDDAARQRGIVVSDTAARSAVDQLIEQKFGPGGRDDFVTLLGQLGASMGNVLDEVKRQQSFTQLVKQVTDGVPQASEAEARALYDAHRAEIVVPPQRRLSNIVVASVEDAQSVLQRAQAGTDFGALAQGVSLDQVSRRSGGDLGYVSAGQLEDRYGQAAFAAPVGGLFGPVQTKSGWNVGKVLDARPAVPVSFEQVQEELRTELRGERQTKTWNDWLGERLHDADITYAARYRPADPRGIPAAGARPSP
jgi:peptidyl-prolyl cis-trans isomerase C